MGGDDERVEGESSGTASRMRDSKSGSIGGLSNGKSKGDTKKSKKESPRKEAVRSGSETGSGADRSTPSVLAAGRGGIEAFDGGYMNVDTTPDFTSIVPITVG